MNFKMYFLKGQEIKNLRKKFYAKCTGKSKLWWHTSSISALRKLRQGDCLEFKGHKILSHKTKNSKLKYITKCRAKL